MAMQDTSSPQQQSSAYSLYALSLFAEKRFIDAADAFSTAASLWNDAIARYNQAVSLMAAGRNEEAQAPLAQSAALDPNAYQVALLQAHLEVRLSQPKAAARSVIRARKLAGKETIFASGLEGVIALLLEQYPEALGFLRQAVREEPDVSAHHLHLAMAALHNGNPDEALTALKRAQSISPDESIQISIKRLERVTIGTSGKDPREGEPAAPN